MSVRKIDMSARPLDGPDFECLPSDLYVDSAYRIVAFTGLDDGALDRLVGLQFNGLGTLPENVPLSHVFVTAEHTWLEAEIEEIAVDYPLFDINVTTSDFCGDFRTCYGLDPKNLGLAGLKSMIGDRFHGLDKHNDPRIKKVYEPRDDYGKLSSPNQAKIRRAQVEISNLSIVRFFDDTPSSGLVVREFYSLAK